MGGGGVALGPGRGAGATGADGWRVPAGVARAPGGVVGDFGAASGKAPTRGPGARSEKFGRASGCVEAGTVGLT